MGDGDVSATPAPTPSSRAGRNLPAAIASGVVLAIVVILSLFTFKWLFAIVVIAALVIAVHEFDNAFAQAGIRLARTPLFVGAVAIPAMAYV